MLTSLNKKSRKASIATHERATLVLNRRSLRTWASWIKSAWDFCGTGVVAVVVAMDDLLSKKEKVEAA
jgi:hypothetical protein